MTCTAVAEITVGRRNVTLIVGGGTFGPVRDMRSFSHWKLQPGAPSRVHRARGGQLGARPEADETTGAADELHTSDGHRPTAVDLYWIPLGAGSPIVSQIRETLAVIFDIA